MVISNPAAVDPTREIFIPVTAGNPAPANSGVLVSGVGEWGEAQLLIPGDFISITDLEVLLIPQNTGASMYLEILTAYGAQGEAYNIHTETGTDRDIGATVNAQNLWHDFADLVNISPMVAGDLVRVTLLYNATAIATNLIFRGVRLKYA